MNITLIGYRGCGKSTVGRLLAQKLHREFVDTDHQVEQIAGMSIPEIFEHETEAGFRKRESAVLESAYRSANCVVSAGGGAVLAEHNRQMMKTAGPVVWLTAPPTTLAARIAKDQAGGIIRPSLTGTSPIEEVTAMLARRFAIYEGTATLTVATEKKTPEEIVDEVISRLTPPPEREDGP